MGYDASVLMERGITFANQMADNLVTVGNNAGSAFDNVLYPETTFSPPWISAGWLSGIQAPAAPALAVSFGNSPQAPVLDAIPVVSVEAAPTFTLAAPAVALPVAPSASLPAAPGVAPTFTSPSLPAEPTFSLPNVPTFENLAIPPAPSVNIPTFASSLPIEDIAAPTETFSYVEQEYKSEMLDTLKAKLLYDLVNGGYGIEPGDETALWDRAREREMRDGEAAIQDAARQMAARGFALPPGAMFAQMESIRQDVLEKTSSLSREIALKRADMYVENRKFTIQQVQVAEQMLITYFGYMMERSLNAAKAIVETGIKVYDAKLARLKYFVDRENARAQVYEVVLKAALANLDAYKIQLEGTRVSADVQRIHAEVYKTQLDGVNALANVYRTEVEAARVKADIEQLKLQAFKTVVETYTAQVAAKQAEFGMYESQIKGEMTKVDVFKAQVGAYGTQVEAYKSKVQAAQIELESRIEPNKLKLDSYRTDIARYSADLQAAQISLQAQINKYDAQIKGFSVATDAAIKNAEVILGTSKANADVAVASARLHGDIAIARSKTSEAVAQAFAATQASLGHAFGTASAAAMQTASGIVAQIS